MGWVSQKRSKMTSKIFKFQGVRSTWLNPLSLMMNCFPRSCCRYMANYRILPIVGCCPIHRGLILEDRVIFQKLLVSKGSTYVLVIHHLIVGRSYKIWVSYLTFAVIFPKKLTWNLKITTLKRKLIFELPILHFRESSPRRKSSTDAIMAHQSHDSFNWVLPMEQQPRFVHNRTDKQRRRHADVAENDKYYKGGFCLHGNKRRTTIHGYIL